MCIFQGEPVAQREIHRLVHELPPPVIIGPAYAVIPGAKSQVAVTGRLFIEYPALVFKPDGIGIPLFYRIQPDTGSVPDLYLAVPLLPQTLVEFFLANKLI